MRGCDREAEGKTKRKTEGDRERALEGGGK